MKKLTLTFTLLLTAAAAAHAQMPTPSDAQRQPMSDRDPIHRDESRIAGANRRNAEMEREADAARRRTPRTFKAEVEVTNHAAKDIKSISWTVTLTDYTGAVIDSYDVKTKTRIAPGSTKKLSKRLRTPRDNVVSVTSLLGYSPAVAGLKVEVTGVTYADGSTSTTP
jgi:hypothetical protein